MIHEETKEQITQWPKKVQKDNQRATKDTHKAKDRVKQTTLKSRVNLCDPYE